MSMGTPYSFTWITALTGVDRFRIKCRKGVELFDNDNLEISSLRIPKQGEQLFFHAHIMGHLLIYDITIFS